MGRLYFNRCLFGLFFAFAWLNIDAQIIQNGCFADQWQIFELDKESGSKSVSFNFSDCPLDVSAYTYLAVEVENTTSVKIITDVKYKGPGENHVNQGRFFIPPKNKKETRLILNREKLKAESSWLDDFDKVRGLPGHYVRHWNAFDLSDIKIVTVTLSWENYHGKSEKVRVKKPYGTLDFNFPSIVYQEQSFPLLDKMGQYVNDIWEGKLSNIKKLETLGKKDVKKYAKASVNNKFSQYGGWIDGPKFEAKGYFYTVKYKGKWWFVDPEGYLFWSQGVTGVGGGSATSTKNRTHIFPDFSKEKLSSKWSLLKPEVENQQINFYKMNLKRKYGENWENLHSLVTIGRMKDWGLNTCGAWSHPPKVIKHPYTLILHPTLQGIGKIKKMVDPFSDDYLFHLKRVLKRVKKYKGDPWNVGVFVNNELHFNAEMSIPLEVLKLNNRVPARMAMEILFAKKYSTISQLNKSWGSAFSSFESINGQNPENYTEAFKKDMLEYLDYFADTYYRITAEELHKVMPHSLYLGSRFHGKAKYNKTVQRAASRHCDVVSYNIYQYSVKDFEVFQQIDKPCIIGEFHFGTGSHGVWGTGLRSAYDLENQAELYKQYIKEAASHPNFIGAHWFQWSDQPATGRNPDGENFRIGLVNVTDQPYLPMIDAIKETSLNLYQMRMQ